MKTNITSVVDLKNLLLETLLNKTDKVTKVAENSVLNGLMYGVAKVMQKGMKDIALIESELFPELAFGEHLDLIAKRNGIAPRFEANQSSVVVKLVGDIGTSYNRYRNLLSTSSGRQFELSEDVTIGKNGYGYVIARSVQPGIHSNIAPRELVRFLNPPLGHKYLTNEAMAVGGRDVETDNTFLQRILEGFNVLSTDTLLRLQQVFISLNLNVLRIMKVGRDSKGNVILSIITQNGVELSKEELDKLTFASKNFLSISDVKLYNNEVVGLRLQNVKYTYVDVDFRVDLISDADIQDLSLRIQSKFLNYFDWRFWKEDEKVEWDDLFDIVKSQSEVRYIVDTEFYPRGDIEVGKASVPRLRSFVMRSLDGKILFENKDLATSEYNKNAVFYQSKLDESYANTVLSVI